MTETDTIFAPATGAVAAAIAVVRISGARTAAILRDLAGAVPPARRASLRHLRDARGAMLDTALVLWFPPPRSYTGEAMAELHLHGGRAVVAGVLDALVALDARPAEPGEFTRRAFLRGRLDLVQAEGIADLIAAETAAQRRLALQQADGHTSAALAGWAATLRETLAWQEALIDFPDEGIPESVEKELSARCAGLKTALDSAAQVAQGASRLRAGLVIAVVGKPNVGKSTLVNALAGRDIAIVAETPGTTRDALEVPLILGDLPITLVDTAGLRDAADPVEQEGVRRARARAASADLVLEVVAVPTIVAEHPGGLTVCNKADLGLPPDGMIGISAKTGVGLDQLRAVLRHRAEALVGNLDAAALSRPRHVSALREAAHWLDAAATPAAPELRAEALRLGLRAISRITGAVDIDTMLDTIFGQFCIGK